MKKESKRIKLVLTGGHASTTAIAVVEELLRRKLDYDWDLYWIGPEHAIEGEKSPTIASTSLPEKSVVFHPIKAARLQRKITGRTLISLSKFPLGFIQSAKLLFKIKPDAILSFGGYASVPVVVVGKLFGIPIMLHDQTYSFNRVNKLLAPLANKIAVARKNSLSHYPRIKTKVTGNPVMTQVTEISPKSKIGNPPTLYITGGSSGSIPINNLIEPILPHLLKEFSVIHQVGYLDYKKFKEIKLKLKKNKNRYEVYKIIDPMQVDGVFRRADIIVSRAGANTVSEILIAKRPAILIPLIIGNLKEQLVNARYAEEFGVAKVLIQSETNSEKLLSEINRTRKDWQKIVRKLSGKDSPDKNAAKSVVDLLLEIIDEKT